MLVFPIWNHNWIPRLPTYQPNLVNHINQPHFLFRYFPLFQPNPENFPFRRSSNPKTCVNFDSGDFCFKSRAFDLYGSSSWMCWAFDPGGRNFTPRDLNRERRMRGTVPSRERSHIILPNGKFGKSSTQTWPFDGIYVLVPRRILSKIPGEKFSSPKWDDLIFCKMTWIFFEAVKKRLFFTGWFKVCAGV